MEKSQLIKKFLSEGFQLDSSAIDFLLKNSEKINEIINKLKQTNTLVVTLDVLKNIFPEKTKIEVLKEYKPKKSFTIEDLTEFFLNRYYQIKEFLSKRIELVNLISIKKITTKTTKFSIIAMVKKISPNKIFVEDNTGSLELSLKEGDKFYLTEDEVLGIVVRKQNEEFYVENIYFPDFSLKKPSYTSNEINCFFIPAVRLREFSLKNFLDDIRKDNNVFFVFIDNEKLSEIKGKLENLPKENTFLFFSPDSESFSRNEVGFEAYYYPCAIKIDNLILFFYPGYFLENYSKYWNLTEEQTFLNLIKKRHLNPNFKFSKKIFQEDPFLLNLDPDIIYVNNSNQTNEINYKSRTFIFTGKADPIIYKINLKTREKFKITLV